MDYPSLEDVLAEGKTRGLPPVEVASAVRNWQGLLNKAGREAYGKDPDVYWQGAANIDNQVHEALAGLSAEASAAETARQFPDIGMRKQFLAALEDGGYNPDNLPPELRPAAEAVGSAGAAPEFRPPPMQSGRIAEGPNELAFYQMRPLPDGSGYEAYVKPAGKESKAVIVPISGDREALKAQAGQALTEAETRYQRALNSAGSDIGWMTDKYEEPKRLIGLNKDRLNLYTNGPDSQVLHIELDQALRQNKDFLDQLPTNRWEQFTTRPLVGVVRSLAQGFAAPTGKGAALTKEGQDAMDVVAPGNIKSRFAAGDEAPIGDQISQGIESIITMAGPSMGARGIGALAGKAGLLAAESTAAAKIGSTAAWGTLYTGSYGQNYAGAIQEADAIQATDPARAARIRSLAQYTSLTKAAIELATERIFPDEAKLLKGEKLPLKSLATMPLKEYTEEYVGAMAGNAVNTISGQAVEDPGKAGMGGFWGSLPMMGLGAMTGRLGSGAADNLPPPAGFEQSTPESLAPSAALFPPNLGPATGAAPTAGGDAAAPAPPPEPAVVATAGRTTAYGYRNDPTPDSNSSAGIGAFVPDDEAAKIKRGEPSDYRLRPGDLAVSPDIESQFRKQGISPGDQVTLSYEDGTTHTGRWMDRTDGSLDGRFDLYSPGGPPATDGSRITGFTGGSGSASGLTAATEVDPRGTVPETVETLREQRRRVVSGARPSMLFPGMTPDEVPREFHPAQDEGLLMTATPAGTFLHPFDLSEAEIQQAVKDGQTGQLLGMATGTKPQDATKAIVQRTAAGVEVTAAAVNADNLVANTELLRSTAQPGDTVTLESPEQVISARLAPTEAAAPAPPAAVATAPTAAPVPAMEAPAAAPAAVLDVPLENTPEGVDAIEQATIAEDALSPMQKAEAWADRTIREGLTRLNTGVDPTILAAYAVKGTAIAARGVKEVAQWSSEMIREFGEVVRPHLSKLYNQATGRADATLTSSPIAAIGEGPQLNLFGQRVKADEQLRESWRKTFQPRETSPFTEEQLVRNVQTWIGREGGLEGATKLFFDQGSGLVPYERNALGQQLARALDQRARRSELAGNAAATQETEALLQNVIESLEAFATEAGQALRSFGLFSKLSPRGIVRQMERQVAKQRTKTVIEKTGSTPAEVVNVVKEAVKAAEAEETAKRVSNADATAKSWIAKLAASQSDTLAWGKASMLSAMEALTRDHLKTVNPDFVNAAVTLGCSPNEANILNRLVLEEHRRSAAIANDSAMEKLTASLQPKLPRAEKVKVPPFIDALLKAQAAGGLTQSAFLEAYAAAFGLPLFTPAFAAEIRNLVSRVEACPQGSWLRNMAQRALMAKLAMWEGIPTSEVLLAFWYSNILSGIGTQVVNIFGNGTHLLLKTVQVILTNHPEHSFRFLQGMLSGGAQGAKQGFQALKNGVPVVKSAEEWQKVDVLEMMWSDDSKTLGRLIARWGAASWGRYVLRMLTAADSFFFQTLKEGRAYLQMSRAMGTGKDFKLTAGLDMASWNLAMDAAKHDLQAAGVAQPTTGQIDRRAYEIVSSKRDAAVIDQAAKFGAQATYNNQPVGPVGVFADMLKLMVKEIPVLRAVVPFVNIPSNVVNQGLDWTPIGLARAAYGKHLFNSKGEVWSRQERYEKAISGAIATAGACVLYAMALSNDKDGEDDLNVPFMIYGEGPKDRAKRQQMPPGWKRFTIKIGKRYYAYNETPLSLILSTVGGALDAERYATKRERAIRAAMPTTERYAQRLGDMLQSGMGAFLSTGTMSSLSKLLVPGPDGTYDYTAPLFRTVAGFIPAQGALRNVAELMDPTVIDTKTFRGTILSNLPMLKSAGQPMLDAFGQNIRQPGTVVLNRFVTPQTSKGPEWDWLKENNLNISGLDNEIFVQKYLPGSEHEAKRLLAKEGLRGLEADRAWRAIEMERHHDRNLTADEAIKFQRESGPLIQNAVKQLRNETKTKPLTQDQLQNELAKRVSAARQIARVRMVK